MIEVSALANLTLAELKRVANGYSSGSKYEVSVKESEDGFAVALRLALLELPYVKKFAHYDEEIVGRYNRILREGYSFGALAEGSLVGLLIAEAHSWNRSLWVHEFHVIETHRGLGIGRRLIEAAAAKAKEARLRLIACETQNTNAAAVGIYRRLGFRIEGVDLSLYTNDDYPEGEIAIFMKRRLA
jgi:ribosomal protein S18 acetylase RimI-like enzyme